MKIAPKATTGAGITVPRAALLPALRLASMVAVSRPTIPWLAHVSLRSGAGELTVRACNLDVEFSRTLECEVRTPIAATVPAHLFLRAVAAMAGEDLHLVQHDTTLALECGPTTATFWHQPPDDMSGVEIEADAEGVDIACEALATLLGRVAHAISREETRYYLNGIYLHAEAGEGLRAVATDGHRLALRATTVAGQLPQALAHGIIMPSSALPLLFAMLNGLQDGAHLRASPNRIEIITSRGVLRANLIDGQYPRYARVIPPEVDAAWITLSRATLATALRRLAIGSPRHQPGMEVTITPDGLHLTTGNQNVEARFAETMPIASGGGWPAETFGIATGYLRDAVANIAGDVRIGRLKDPSNAIMIRDGAAPTALFLIMPRRV